MTRSTPLAIAAGLALLAGCGAQDRGSGEAERANAVAPADNLTVEDVPSDSLAAPADMPLDSESGAGGNAVGSASGGNAM